jgi:hypothetical protein
VTDLWEDEGFGSGGAADEVAGEDDWDEGEESLETTLEDELDDPNELEDELGDDDEAA